MQIAHVGANNPFSDIDECAVLKSMIAIDKANKDFLKSKKPVLDIINLNSGRDFLTEDKQYDVVVMHSIFLGNPEIKTENPLTQVSPLHSEEKWREQLEKSGSAYIVVCEMLPSSLSGWRLGELCGYQIVERDTEITLYKRL